MYIDNIQSLHILAFTKRHCGVYFRLAKIRYLRKLTYLHKSYFKSRARVQIQSTYECVRA